MRKQFKWLTSKSVQNDTGYQGGAECFAESVLNETGYQGGAECFGETDPRYHRRKVTKFLADECFVQTTKISRGNHA